jgi:hypothetical protein
MPSPVVLFALALQTATQAPMTESRLPRPDSAPPALPAPTVVLAARAPEPPVIDGREVDPVWQGARVITGFRQWNPTEDGDPRFETEARIAYDERFLYAFVRAHDPRPDSIVALLARRDSWTPSDRIGVVFDSYHDRRSGYEFWVNAAGVKTDAAISNDGDEDDAWDAVWDVEVRIDSLGWAAEFRIPLSQLRYAPRDANTFGIMVMRDIQRYGVRESWPLLRRSRSGWPSQFGTLEGLVGLGTPRRLEVTPYGVTKNVQVQSASGTAEREQQVTAGADIKYGLTSNLTVDATINPDFGQVEADPGVLNLSGFETFFQERRPFFLEGIGTFRFRVNCSQVNCGSESMFYSRRIGRAPQLNGLYYDANAPTATTIVGAAKVTGRLAGMNIGFLDAVTARETGAPDTLGQPRTTEPLTNYLTLRLQQDLRHGESGIGLIVTGVNRALDEWTDAGDFPVADPALAPYSLRRSAHAAAVDVRHRFAGRRYRISGRFGLSRVTGSTSAIAATQASPVHYFQRPDAGVTLDSTRTSLTGDFQEIAFGKVAGTLRFETAYLRRSAGFEINDLGYLRRADQQSWTNWAGLQFNQPTRVYRQANWNFNWWQYWTAASRMPTERAFNTNIHAQLPNRWWVHAGGTIGQVGATYCDFCTRGGPAVRQDPYLAPWAGISGDDRNVVIPELWVNYTRGDGGRSEFFTINPQVTVRMSSRFNTSVGLSLTRNTNDAQWYGNFIDTTGVTHYTFAHLPQDEFALDLRVDYTMTRTLSLQVYAQPFISKGMYSNVRELDDPRAEAYDARFQPYADPGYAFNYMQFRSNVVLRWEYRPGSALFVVWTQGRDDYAEDYSPNPPQQAVREDVRDLFRLAPNNTLLLKASYWFSW